MPEIKKDGDNYLYNHPALEIGLNNNNLELNLNEIVSFSENNPKKIQEIDVAACNPNTTNQQSAPISAGINCN